MMTPKEIVRELKERHNEWWKILILPSVVFLVCLFCFSGCSLLKKGVNINPAIANQQGENDNNIVKLDEVNALKTDGKIVDTSRVESVGGNKSIINDSELLKFIFDKFGVIVASLFGFLLSFFTAIFALIKFILYMGNKTIKAKDEMISVLLKRQSEQEAKMDTWQNEQIAKIINGKGGKV